jgi:hypothetical protein
VIFALKSFLFAFVFSAVISVPLTLLLRLDSGLAVCLGMVLSYVGLWLSTKLIDDV